MSGRLEKEQEFEKKISDKLKNCPKIMSEYYYHLAGAGRTPMTSYNYILGVVAFINYVYNDNCPNDFYKHIKSTHINQYIASLRTRDIKGKTERTSDSFKAVQWSALNSFFEFLIPEYIKENPVKNTHRPKMRDNPKVTYLTSDEISELLEYVEENAQERFVNRDLCWLKIGFSTGLRVSAILQIDINDIDFENNQIRVTEKGDYDEYIMFGENLKKQLIACINDRDRFFSDVETNALFVSQKGSRLSDDALSRLLKQYAENITNKKITPHVMRHSCATNLYEKTGDIYLCSRQLNHKNVATTMRYAEISKEKQRMATNILDDLI